ncbi:MAG: aspartate 1-decarboxylase [Verrucomicrobiales bacterium]
MLRIQLKSKIHRAVVTGADIQYEGSITIPPEMMKEADLWPGERVLVASVTSGNRLETYVQPGIEGSSIITINGGAAHLIKKGDRITIMAWGLSESLVQPIKLLCDENNRVIKKSYSADPI